MNTGPTDIMYSVIWKEKKTALVSEYSFMTHCIPTAELQRAKSAKTAVNSCAKMPSSSNRNRKMYSIELIQRVYSGSWGVGFLCF